MRLLIFSLLVIWHGLHGVPLAGEQKLLHEGGLKVFHDASISGVARDVAREYPAIRAELEVLFGWRPAIAPEVRVLLLKEEEFQKMVGRAPIVAFASSRDNLIVVSPLRAEKDPETFLSVLKHEVVHLYLGWYTNRADLPRWLNEGVAQWASGGVSELLAVGRSTEIEKATILGRLIPLRSLETFPQDERPLRLAYQESHSIVSYIVDEHGREGLLGLLARLREGETVEAAIPKSLGIGFRELEDGWRKRLKLRYTLLVYVSNNLYAILFVLGALVSVYAFAKVILKIRSRRKEEEEEPTYPYW